MSQEAQLFIQGARGSAAVQKFDLSEALRIYKDILMASAELKANEERLVAANNLMSITGFLLWNSASKDPVSWQEIESYAKSFMKYYTEVSNEVQESFQRRQDLETVKRVAAGDRSAIEEFIANIPSSDFVKEHAAMWNTNRLAALDKETEKKQSNVIWFKKDVPSLRKFMQEKGLKKISSLSSSDLNAIDEIKRIGGRADLTIVTVDSDFERFDIYSNKLPESSTLPPKSSSGCLSVLALICLSVTFGIVAVSLLTYSWKY